MEDDCAQRKFAFCKILWKIEHFCLITCRRNWVLSSPEFSVRDPCFTRWMLMLKLKPNNHVIGDSIISSTLKRLDNDSGPEEIRANWKISILNGKLSECNYTENEHYFRKNACHQVDVQVMAKALEAFQPFEMDVLYIQCELIVSNDNVKFTTSIEQGIGLLSKDMHKFLLSKKIDDVDVYLKTKDKSIPAHKAILYARNPTFAKILKKIPDDTGDIDMLPFMNSDALEKIVAYLYSGDLEIVIGKPSISIYECAKMLDISEVLDYYNPDDLTMRSSADPSEFAFIWFIREFESLNQNYVLSPTFTDMASGTSWRLRLLPKGAENYNGFVSISAEVSPGMIPLDICSEFAIKDLKRNFFCYSKVQKTMTAGDFFGFHNFVSRDYLKSNSLLEHGTLRIAFKVQMSTKAPVSSCESSSISIASTNTNTEALQLFSEDMAKLLHKGKYSNAAILCENRLFQVHKCIFASRSDSLSKKLWNELRNEDEIKVSYINPDVLNILLQYIYSGTIPDYGYDIIRDVYKNAESFSMYGLMNKCLKLYNENAN